MKTDDLRGCSIFETIFSMFDNTVIYGIVQYSKLKISEKKYCNIFYKNLLKKLTFKKFSPFFKYE